MEQVWNGYGTDTQLNITFQVLHSMVWNGGVWNGIRGLDPELWIGVWIGMCARPCSGTLILSGSQMWRTVEVENIIFYLDAGMQTLSFQLFPIGNDEPPSPTDRLVKKGSF